MISKKRIEELRDQLKSLQSRHDSSAVNTATYIAIKSLEKDIAWNETHSLAGCSQTISLIVHHVKNW